MLDRDTHFLMRVGGEVTLVVAPDVRRRGHAQELLACLPAESLTAWSHGDHPAARHLADKLGWSRVRELWVMRTPAGPVAQPPTPAGITLRSYTPADADALLAVNAAAFADHPEQGGMDQANLAQRMSQDWYDPQDLLVAERDGALVGFHWTKRSSPTVGEVYVIGVDPSQQGTGLGSVLLAAGLNHMYDTGCAEIELYVESDNPAVRLYERMGFSHAAHDTHVHYHKSA